MTAIMLPVHTSNLNNVNAKSMSQYKDTASEKSEGLKRSNNIKDGSKTREIEDKSSVNEYLNKNKPKNPITLQQNAIDTTKRTEPKDILPELIPVEKIKEQKSSYTGGNALPILIKFPQMKSNIRIENENFILRQSDDDDKSSSCSSQKTISSSESIIMVDSDEPKKNFENSIVSYQKAFDLENFSQIPESRKIDQEQNQGNSEFVLNQEHKTLPIIMNSAFKPYQPRPLLLQENEKDSTNVQTTMQNNSTSSIVPIYEPGPDFPDISTEKNISDYNISKICNINPVSNYQKNIISIKFKHKI
ncbi:hypothetical protein GVAV_003375 [Gurleya vavrai]